jgi:hypothetical protein
MAQKKAPKGWTGESTNMDEVSTEAPPPLERAIYRATIVEAEAQTSKKGGAMIAVTLEVHTRYGEPEGGVAELVSKGKAYGKIYDFLGFEGYGLRKLKQVSVETEVPAPSQVTEEAAAAFCAELTGKDVWIRSRLEENQDRSGKATGEFSAKVDRYLTTAQCEQAAAALAGNALETPAETDAPVQRRAGKRRAA